MGCKHSSAERERERVRREWLPTLFVWVVHVWLKNIHHYHVFFSLCSGHLVPLSPSTFPKDQELVSTSEVLAPIEHPSKDPQMYHTPMQVMTERPRIVSLSRTTGAINISEGRNVNPRKYLQKAPDLANLQGGRTMPKSLPTTTPAFCRHCGKKFMDLIKLKSHELYHAHAGRHPCRYCGKAFPFRGNLRNHERSHTGERPYLCRYCGKGFTRMPNCRRHEAKKH